MTNQSENFSQHDENQEREEQKVSWFKENTLKIRSLMDKTLENKVPQKQKSSNAKIYMINVSETNSNGDYFLEYSRTISSDDFFDLIEDFFNVDVEDSSDFEYPNHSDEKAIYFESFEEVIDYLKNRKNEEK